MEMGIAALLSAVAFSPVHIAHDIRQLAWMAGDWTCEIWGGTFDESWMAPAAGTMQGIGRHISNGKTGFMEFLSIEPDSDGNLTMWITLGAPSKGERKPVPFKASTVSTSASVWENFANDFPSKIAYALNPDKSMDCVITGGNQKETFRFKRKR